MKEFSDKELEVFYKEEKMTAIPDLWKNIEGNLAPKISGPEEDRRVFEAVEGKKLRRLGWLTGLAAAAAVVFLAVPAWGLLEGSKKSYSESDSSMEANEYADADSDGSSFDFAESPGEGAAEIYLEVEFIVEQVQNTPEGYLIAGEIVAAEKEWFEAGEQVTLFYEGAAYGEADFSGNLRVMLEVEENNLKILEILP